MKLTMLAIFALALSAGADTDPIIVDVQLRTAYIPVGFDTNDKVQIVAEGYFPSACYKLAEIRTKIDQDTKSIRLSALAYKHGGNCPRIIVPFNETINLGLLKTGSYQVSATANDNENQLGELKVVAATNTEPDDYLYAPVSQAFFSQNGDGKSFVTLTGDFPNSCYRMREVVIRVQTNVIVVQPIAETTEDNCDERAIPYAESIEIKGLEEGKYLIHVRSLNGSAINTLVRSN